MHKRVKVKNLCLCFLLGNANCYYTKPTIVIKSCFLASSNTWSDVSKFSSSFSSNLYTSSCVKHYYLCNTTFLIS